MKKLLLTVGAGLLLALNTHATMVLSNSFGYADGALVTVSAGSPLGVWTTHSGTAGQVDVLSGVLNLSQAESEDVNTVVTNATFPTPFTTQILYASFKVNFSTLPTGTGTYFAHFKDSSTGFRCRVFAQATGAAVGKYRLGIGNFSVSSASAVITTDLDPSVEYKVVIRCQGATNSTIWISPTSEASIVNRADASDSVSNPYTGTYAFGLRQGANTQGICTIDDLLIGTTFADVQTVGGPPSISGLVNVSIFGNSNTGPLPFLISDVETPANSLVLSATSSNPTLVPNSPANLTFGGSDGNRTLTVTPATGQEGTANIEVVVTDGNSEQATNSFVITVGAPSISAIAAQVAPTNSVFGPIAFTVNDGETAPASLTVTATSSSQTVIADSDISIQNLGGGNRSITLVNVGGAGLTEITVTVTDGTFNISSKFSLTAYPLIGLVLGEPFAYADGPLTNSSGGFWTAYSGATNGGADVINGNLLLSSTNGADINAFLTNTPYAADGGYVFYSRFVVNYQKLPTANGVGDYFAFFKEFANSQFRARVFATTNGAAPGYYRLGIANGGFVTTTFPWDLTPGASYVVISRYNVATATSKLWVSPVSEVSPSVDATDLASPVTIYSYAFREDTGFGTVLVDDLAVGTSFSDVQLNITPSAASLNLEVFGGNAVLSWSNPVFALQSATNVAGPYTAIATATSPYTNAISGTQKYFRLKY